MKGMAASDPAIVIGRRNEPIARVRRRRIAAAIRRMLGRGWRRPRPRIGLRLRPDRPSSSQCPCQLLKGGRGRHPKPAFEPADRVPMQPDLGRLSGSRGDGREALAEVTSDRGRLLPHVSNSATARRKLSRLRSPVAGPPVRLVRGFGTPALPGPCKFGRAYQRSGFSGRSPTGSGRRGRSPPSGPPAPASCRPLRGHCATRPRVTCPETKASPTRGLFTIVNNATADSERELRFCSRRTGRRGAPVSRRLFGRA